jgi:hypothetical protein
VIAAPRGEVAVSDKPNTPTEDLLQLFAIVLAVVTGLGGLLLALISSFSKNENYTAAGLGLLASALAFGLLCVGLSIKK